MLKQRILTALVLVAVVLAALFAENILYWRALISVVVLVGFYEWLRFCEIDSALHKVASFAVFLAVFYGFQSGIVDINIVVPLACVVWLALLVFTLTDALAFLHQRWVKLVIGVFVLAVAGWLVIEIKTIEHGALWVICFIGAVSFADIGAYFVGRKFGKTKLAPKVSPGKTVEGLFGGLGVVTIIFVPILFSVFDVKNAMLLTVAVLVTSIVSVGGDLFESKLKRHVGLKDSSQILPGHGGMLDRVDSMLAGSPFFFFGLTLLS